MTATRDPMQLSASGVTAAYYKGQPILQDVGVEASPATVTVILGPNGSGKSTMLRVLAGLLAPSSGTVTISQGRQLVDVTSLPAHKRLGQGIAYLPQGHSTFPAMSVHDNILIGAWTIRRDRRRVSAAVAGVYERYPQLRDKRRAPAGSLSGGQQRILEVARQLVCDPGVVLIDEPSAGVAPAIAQVMYAEIASMRDDGRAVVLVDQDLRPALAIADHVYTLRSGRNDQHGPAADFLSDSSSMVRGWLAAAEETSAVESGGVGDRSGV